MRKHVLFFAFLAFPLALWAEKPAPSPSQKPSLFSAVFPKKVTPVTAPPSTDLPAVLTLKTAEAYALANHPDIKAASFSSAAADQNVVKTRADLFPQLTGNAVIAKAQDDDSRMASTGAGLGNPTILTREAEGLYLSQLITDFGKTALFTRSSIYYAQSAKEKIQAVQAAVLLGVDQAYFSALGARALVRLTRQEVATNQLLYDRVKALTASNLKSNLDLSLQQANLAQTRLLQVDAEGRYQEAMASLAAAIGSREEAIFTLAEEDKLPPAPAMIQPLITEALSQRPDIIALRFQRDAALKYAAAEGAARLPVVTGLAAGGLTSYQDKDLPHQFGMVGVNINVPLFTGGKLTAQQKEAQLKARAFEEYLEDQETLALRDVRTAWISVQTSFKGIAVSREFLDASSTAFDLAQSLYTAGTSSIVEVSQADLQRLQAEIAYIDAKYQYQARLSVLSYQTGSLR
ncbi:TolC family protein [soil metagenome]